MGEKLKSITDQYEQKIKNLQDEITKNQNNAEKTSDDLKVEIEAMKEKKNQYKTKLRLIVDLGLKAEKKNEEYQKKEKSFKRRILELLKINKDLVSQSNRLKSYLLAKKKTVNDQNLEIEQLKKTISEKSQTSENIPTYVKNFRNKSSASSLKRKVVEYESICSGRHFFSIFTISSRFFNNFVLLVASSSKTVCETKQRRISHTVTTAAINIAESLQVSVPGFKNTEERVESYLEDQLSKYERDSEKP